MKVAKIFLRKGFEWLGTSFLVAFSILKSPSFFFLLKCSTELYGLCTSQSLVQRRFYWQLNDLLCDRWYLQMEAYSLKFVYILFKSQNFLKHWFGECPFQALWQVGKPWIYYFNQLYQLMSMTVFFVGLELNFKLGLMKFCLLRWFSFNL